MQAKNEMEAIKLLNEKTKTNSLSVANILQNSWSTNGQNSIFKTNDTVFVNLALRNGTDKNILALPERL